MRPARLIGLVGGAAEVLPPAGFDWTPPVKVFYQPGAGYTTDYVADDWIVPTTATIWVSRAGNDANPGTEAQPLASIRQALINANGLGDAGVTINVLAGEYTFNNHFSGQLCTKNLNILAVGGRVLCTNHIPVPTWVDAGGGAFVATRSGVTRVYDRRYPDIMPDGAIIPVQLQQVADLAACQAQPGSWAISGSTVWVHCIDGRVPDAGAGGDVRILTSGSGFLYQQSGGSIYVRGFDMEMSPTTFFASSGAGAAIDRVVFDDCRVWLQTLHSQKAFNALSVSLVIYHNLRAYRTEGDAFSISIHSFGRPESSGVEINCRSYYSGVAATAANIINGSTAHSNNRYVRVNGFYRDTYGPVVQDVQTVQSWALGTSARGCLLGIGAHSQDASWSAGQATGSAVRMWLDGCDFGGAFYDMYAGANCQVRYARMPAPVSSFGDVAAYTP